MTNPFLKNPVAQTVGESPTSFWYEKKRSNSVSHFTRRAGVAMVAAGLSFGMPAKALDVNVASVSQLENVRGIGPRTAKMIVHERSRAGVFTSMQDLSDRIKGLGERRVRALAQAGLKVGSAAAESSMTGPSVTGPSVTGPSVMGSLTEHPHVSRQSITVPAKPEIIVPQAF